MAVTAKTYLVVVGTAGRASAGFGNNQASQGQSAVYGGGGTTNGWAGNGGPGSGGGLTGLFYNNSFTQGNAILIAGAGGGGGASRAGVGNRGGAGGGTTGQDGTADYQGFQYAGRGGTQGAGGTALTVGNGCGSSVHYAGLALQGSGNAQGYGCYGGGGGSGYWGGSHGSFVEPNTMGGAGGGSGYAHPTKVVNATLTQGNRETPANAGSSLRSGAGASGLSAATGGRLIIRYAG